MGPRDGTDEPATYAVDIQFQAGLAPGLLEITGGDPASFCPAN
jgi:hypothetical protein